MEPVRVTEVIPNYIGNFGKVWNFDIPQFTEIKEERKEQYNTNAFLAGWIVFAPQAHPMWFYYFIACITLKDIEGIESAVVYKNKEATHEIFVMALNPEEIPFINYDNIPLKPINFAAQWKSDSDEAAIGKVKAAVFEIVNGILSPDTDHITMWIERFGNSNLKGLNL